jgi:hypothetical protein
MSFRYFGNRGGAYDGRMEGQMIPDYTSEFTTEGEGKFYDFLSAFAEPAVRASLRLPSARFDCGAQRLTSTPTVQRLSRSRLIRFSAFAMSLASM